MKKRLALIAFVSASVMALVLSSCLLGGVSIEERLDSFIADLNETGRPDIYLNFHPSLTSDYDAIKTGALVPDWDSLFPEGDIPYALIGLDTTDPNNVTATIDGVLFSKPIAFRMAQDGQDWQIDDLWLDGTWEIQ